MSHLPVCVITPRTSSPRVAAGMSGEATGSASHRAPKPAQ
jgi:hypothetical protein